MKNAITNGQLAISVQEAAELLGVSTPIIYQLANRADFPAVRVGRRILVHRKGLEEWLERATTQKEA